MIDQSLYFSLRIFFKLPAYIFFNSLIFLKEYPELSPKFFSIYQELKQITHRQELKHTTHHMDLQKTTNCNHCIPYNHI